MNDKSSAIERSLSKRLLARAADYDSGAARLPPWRLPWVTTPGQSAFPTNFKTGVPYSAINVITLWMAAEARSYPTHRWLTKAQAESLGGHVDEHEQGVQCVFIKSRSGQPDGKTTRPSDDSFTVYHTSQCVGLRDESEGQASIPDGVTPLELNCRALREIAQMAIDNSGLQIAWGGRDPCYMSGPDMVWMPDGFDREMVGDYEGFVETLSHELVHASGHPKRLARFAERTTRAQLHEQDHGFDELVAELGSAFLCAQLGIPLKPGRYWAERAKWLLWKEALENDPQLLSRVSSEASRAARFLVDGSKLKVHVPTESSVNPAAAAA